MSRTESLGSFHSIPKSLWAGEASQNSLFPKCILAHERLTLGCNIETMRDKEYGICRVGTFKDGFSALIALAMSFHHI